MIPELKGQKLRFNAKGQLLEIPGCLVCNDRKGSVYSEVRQQFICGKCYYQDYKQNQKIYLEHLLKKFK